MPEQTVFEFGRFRLDPVARSLSRNGEIIPIRPFAFDLLQVLVENHGQTLTKVELIKRVWGTDGSDDRNFHVTLHDVRQALGDSAQKPLFIVRDANGYRFAANVKTVGQEAERYLLHIAVSSTLYAALYGTAVLLEIAYEFDRYGRAALKIAPIVFGSIFITTVTGLLTDRKLTLKNKRNGLVGAVLIFFVAAFIVFGVLTRFLPNSTITLAEFQTYPAQAAYLKDMLYFLVLALLFLIFPFHFIASLKREVDCGHCDRVIETIIGSKTAVARVGAVYPRFWALALLLIAFAVISLVMTAHLLDNLKPGEYRNLFTLLVYVRGALYFGLGIECLAWYRKALDDIRSSCSR